MANNFRVWVEPSGDVGPFRVRCVFPGEATKKKLFGNIRKKSDANALAKLSEKRWINGELGKSDPDAGLYALTSEFLKGRRENPDFSPRTIRHFEMTFGALRRETNWKSLGNLTREALIDWRTKMVGSHLKPWTIFGRLSDLRTFVHWLTDEKRALSISPFRRTPSQDPVIPEKPHGEPKFYTEAQWMALDTALAQIHMPTRILCNLCYYCGLRKQEALDVEVGDLEWHDGRLTLNVRQEISKGHYGAGLIDVDPGFAAELISSLGGRQTGKIVQATRYQVDHFFRRARDLAGLAADKLTIHGQRHSFAKEILTKGGVNLAAAKEMLRHRNIASTQVYAKFERGYFREAVDRRYKARLQDQAIAGDNTIKISEQGDAGK